MERKVLVLIHELIKARIEPENFCVGLEKVLNASPQPCLIGFLKKSLPLFRQSLMRQRIRYEDLDKEWRKKLEKKLVEKEISFPPPNK